jgi:general secretion pathway protein A
LNDKLNSNELTQLAQRVRLRFHLTPLSRSDAEAYIHHRLEVAGSAGRQIFEPESMSIIYRYTGGIPRLINTLCDTSMMAAFAKDLNVVTVAEVQAAVEELRWSEYAERSVRLPTLNTDSTGERRLVLGRVLLAVGGKTVAEAELKLGRFIIGRTGENDLQVDSKFVSRHHAQIITTLHTSIIEDLNSTNGIYSRKKRVRRRILNDGDVIHIGQHEIMYIDERTPRHQAGERGDDAVPLLDDTMETDTGDEFEPDSTQVVDSPVPVND